MLTVSEAAANQKLTALLALWEQKRAERVMPRRNEFSIADLRSWLGNLALIDLGEGRATFRLCGINLFPRFGGDMTGRAVGDLPGEVGQSLRDCVARVRATVLPSSATHVQIIQGESVTFDELGLPLSADGAEMKIVLFASYPAMTRAAW